MSTIDRTRLDLAVRDFMRDAGIADTPHNRSTIARFIADLRQLERDHRPMTEHDAAAAAMRKLGLPVVRTGQGDYAHDWNGEAV